MALNIPKHILEKITRRFPNLEKEDVVSMTAHQFILVKERIEAFDMKPVLLHRFGTFGTSQETIDRIRKHSTKHKEDEDVQQPTNDNS